MRAATISPAVFEAAQLGDRSAIAELLARAQPDIRRYAQAACRTSADAEDAAQEALWLLHRRVGSIRSLVTFSGWLFQVVRRECLRLARRTGLTSAGPADEAVVDSLIATRTDLDLRMDLVAAIESLPPTYREVTLLRDVEELTIDEIAARLGLSRAATKSRLHRARSLVREYLLR